MFARRATSTARALAIVSTKPAAMASNGALYSSATLKEQDAQTYQSMSGRLQQPLLKALEVMGYQYTHTWTRCEEKVDSVDGIVDT